MKLNETVVAALTKEDVYLAASNGEVLLSLYRSAGASILASMTCDLSMTPKGLIVSTTQMHPVLYRVGWLIQYAGAEVEVEHVKYRNGCFDFRCDGSYVSPEDLFRKLFVVETPIEV